MSDVEDYDDDDDLVLDNVCNKPFGPFDSSIGFAFETYLREGGACPEFPPYHEPEPRAWVPQFGAWVYGKDESGMDDPEGYDSDGTYV